MNDRTWLKVLGVLFCVLAISNFTKPLEMQPNVGFVFFGMRQRGLPNLLLAPLAGLFLLAYGTSVLRMKRIALPMSRIYAVYVALNLVLFTFRMSDEALARPIFGIVYAVIALAGSWGATYLLLKHHAELT